MANIMGDDQRWHFRTSRLRKVGFCVAKETDRGANKSEVVENITADGGVRRRPHGARRPRLN